MYHPTRRRRALSSLRIGSWLPAFLALSLSLVSLSMADDLTQAYCSNQNTAETDASSSTWQSNGLCKTTCQDNYALAIVQGSNCWCSNYIPADQSSVSSDCNKKCQGYPYEDCGNDDTGMFGYVLLNKSPSGTSSPSSAPATSSSPESSSSDTSDAQDSSSSTARAQTVFNSVTVTNERTLTPSASVIISTVTDTDTPSSSSKSQPASSSAPATTSAAFIPPKSQQSASSTWTPTPVTTVQVVTISNRPVTQTVTNMPTVPPDQANTQKVESKSVSGGLIAGIVIATVLAALILAAALFCCWRRRKQRLQGHTTVGVIGSEAPSSRPTRTTSVLSRTGLLEKVYPSAAVAQKSNGGSQSNTLGPDGSGGISPISEKRNSRPLFYDQRLNPDTLMDFDNGSRVSVNTLPDNRDFSRTLNIRNPDPSGWD